MPVYDYKCRDHGPFYELQTLENHDQPCICPACGQLSPRIIRVAPEILEMAKSKRQAYEANERAQHEPIVSSKDQREHDKQHRSQCGCGHPGKKSKLFYTAKGEKHFPSMRPWMISH
jgi:putative FmdB family regulatory protein